MNIIIVGCGRVGRNIAEQLNTEEHSITVIDNDQVALDRIEDTQNILTINGNGATLEILDEADIDSADLLIAVTPTDELNLYTCLLAKQKGIETTIARVRNPQYSIDAKEIVDNLQVSLTINPEKTAAEEIARLIKYPAATKIGAFGQGVADLIKLKIKEGCTLANKRVMDCSNILRDYIKICTVERNNELYIPNGEFEILPGDYISIVSPSKAAMKLFKLLGYESAQGNDVIILGGGRISFYLAKTLKEASINVKIIEKKTAICEALSEELNGVTIINGDAMDESLLTAEGIDRADTIVSLLSTDEENVLVSLYAQQINTKAKVITELGNLKLSSIIENLPLDTTINPKQLTGENIIRHVRGLQNSIGSNVETMYRVGNNQAEALEFHVKKEGKVTGKSISSLSFLPDLQISCIIRNNRLIIPKGDDTIEKNDKVFIISKTKGLANLDDIVR